MANANWREMYEDLSSKFGHLNDLGSEVYELESVGEPLHTLSAAGSLAAAAEGLTKALEQDWALYTIQEAAAVAAALHATMQAAGENLHALRRAVARIEDRGELGVVVGDDETASEAVDRLDSTVAELHAPMEMLEPAITGLATTPSTSRLPRTVHENMAAIANLLGEIGQLTTCEDGHKPDATTEGCGCTIHVQHEGDLHYFDYSGFDWTLIREKGGTPLSAGGKVFTDADMVSLGSLDPLSHPRQIVDALRTTLHASDQD